MRWAYIETPSPRNLAPHNVFIVIERQMQEHRERKERTHYKQTESAYVVLNTGGQFTTY